MLASQLIYTSWKNGDSLKKGFMVYSKTSDISEQDTHEILKIMRYKPLPSLPYSPTKEEIDNMFPRNLAYFNLPSGKYCLAQACYVGQDYTNRWGNYIIHAFVFEKNEELKPLTFFGWDEFRRCLTEEELNGPADPAPLAKYNIPNAVKTISEQEIRSFYDSERLTVLKKLVQTIINNYDKKIKINFSDKFENIKYWLGPLNLILPKEVLSKITFATYMNDSFDGILISCLEQIQSSAYFNYGDENYVAVFDIKNNSINEVSVDSFTNKVCDLMANNYFSVVTYISDINSRSIKYATNDYVLVDNLISFEKGNYQHFTDVNLFKKLLVLVLDNNQSQKDTILENVLQYLKSSKFNLDEINQLLSLIGNYANHSLQSEINEYKLNILIDKNQSMQFDSLYTLVKQNFTNNWQEIYNLILDKTYTFEVNNYNLLLFQVYTIIKSYDYVNGGNNCLVKIDNLYKHFVSIGDFSNLKKLVEMINNNSKMIGNSVLTSTRDYVLNQLAYNLDMLAQYFSIVNYDALYVSEILQELLIIKNDSYSLLVDQYYQLSKLEPNLTKKIEMSTQNSSLKDLFDKVRIRNFGNLQNVSYADLKDIYNTYINLYRNGMVESVNLGQMFLVKCEEHLRKFKGKDLIREIQTIFNELFKQNQHDVKLLNLLNEYLFNGTSFVDFEVALDNSPFLNEFKACIINNHLSLSKKIDLYEEGKKIKQQASISGYQRKETMKKIIKSVAHIRVTTFGQTYSQQQSRPDYTERNVNYYHNTRVTNYDYQLEQNNQCTNGAYYSDNIDQNNMNQTTVPMFIENLDNVSLAEEYVECFGKTFALMCISLLEYEDLRDGISKVLGYIFEPFYKTSNFRKVFVEALVDEFDRLEKGLSVMFDYALGEELFYQSILDILTSFLETINKKQFKKITTVVEKKVLYATKYRNYIDKYNENHKKSIASIFGSIFGKK